MKPDAGAVYQAEWEAAHSADTSRVRLIDLAVWAGRGEDKANLEELLDWYRTGYGFVAGAPPSAQGDLLGTLYLDGVPAEYAAMPLQPDPVSDEDYEEFGSLPEGAALPGDFASIVSALEADVRATKFELPDGLVRRVLTAWLRGDIVVLVGQPGTGKTRFATTFADAVTKLLNLEAEPLLIPVNEEYDESQFIGYERLDGTPALRDFAQHVVRTERPLEPHVVILEEFNLAVLERYLASVLGASQESSRRVSLPGGGFGQLPVDSFVIATCNSFRDEPETRTRLSSPAKRRSTIITMPNVLWTKVAALSGGVDDADFGDTIAGLAIGLVKAEVDRLTARDGGGQATTFDSARAELLVSVDAIDRWQGSTRESLAGIAHAILGTSEGRSWFTLGLLRDVALTLAMAERDANAEAAALVEVVCDKLVHQLRGPYSNGDQLVDAVAGLPGADEVRDLVERMKESGISDELQPLV
jgi:hypothetical protein